MTERLMKSADLRTYRKDRGHAVDTARPQASKRNPFYQAIIETLRQLSEILSPAQILKTIVRNAGKTLQADRCSFVLVNEIKYHAKVVVAYENSRLRGLPLDLDTYPEINRAIATHNEVIIADM